MPYKLDRDKIQEIVAESIKHLLDKSVGQQMTDADIDDELISTASQAADDIMDMSSCDEDLEIEIVVEGGCVTDVNGLPDGWRYVLNDKD